VVRVGGAAPAAAPAGVRPPVVVGGATAGYPAQPQAVSRPLVQAAPATAAAAAPRVGGAQVISAPVAQPRIVRPGAPATATSAGPVIKAASVTQLSGGVAAPVSAAPPRVISAGSTAPTMSAKAVVEEPVVEMAGRGGGGAVPIQTMRGLAMGTIGEGADSLLEGLGARDSKSAAIKELLQRREKLKQIVKQVFRDASGGQPNLDINGLQRYCMALANTLMVPHSVFGDIQDLYERFDLDDDGSLSYAEVYRLTFFQLARYFQEVIGVQEFSNALVKTSTVQREGFTVTKTAGSGSQGTVHFATTARGKEVCLKSIPKVSVNPTSLAELQDEIKAMRLAAASKHILQYEDFFQDHANYYLVMESLKGGDLQDIKARAKAQGVALTESYWQNMFRQCLEGCLFMHEKALMHCDIKEANIMLKTQNMANPEVVFIDFGVARAMASDEARPCGTPGYIPPEVYGSGKWYPQGDMFSLGVTIMQIICDQTPPSGARKLTDPGIFLQGCAAIPDIASATQTREPPWHILPREMPGLQPVLRGMMEKDFRKRMKAPVALKEPWFKAAVAAAQAAAAKEPKRTTKVGFK